MKKKGLFAAVMAALVTFGLYANATDASSEPRVDDKKKLVEENKALRQRLDSLKQELDAMKERIAINDSIDEQIREIYIDGEERGSSLAPEDYTVEVTDSLLNVWYEQQSSDKREDEQYDMDSVRFQSNVPDQVYVERIKRMNSFITLPYNEIVRNYIILYSEKMPTKMGEILGQCDLYMPIFQEIFNKYDLPEELKAMAVIESAMNPLAVSKAGAKGMWQFMYNTAKLYGLKIDSFVDERMDPVKSADAAARYLRDSYEIFGDWNLAIASYNCGAGNVNKAIRRSGGKREFWDIWPYLPKETRGYVPAFVGALYAMNYSKEHGLKASRIDTPAHIDTFKVNKMLHFKQVNELAGVPLGEIRRLNPQYRHDIIPGNEGEFVLRIPYNYTNSFIEHEDSIYVHKADSLFNPVTIKQIREGGDGERIVYKVKSGDNLGKIAGKYRVTVAQLKKWNNLKSTNIRIGQKLIIYRGGRGPSATSSGTTKTTTSTGSSSKTTSSTTTGATAGTTTGATTKTTAGETTYTVKSGDTLYSIARQFPGVSAQNIMEYNKIGSDIKPGMKIRIPNP